MHTECSADLFGFAPVEKRAVAAGFDGGRMTSDAGGAAAGGDGPGDRRADRGGARPDARCRPSGALPSGHAEGPPDALGEASDRSAVAAGATGRAGQALGARRRALRSGAKPRPCRQGAGNPAAPVEAVVDPAETALDNGALPRGAAHDAARDQSRTAWRLVTIEVAAEDATFSYRLDRNKLRQTTMSDGSSI